MDDHSSTMYKHPISIEEMWSLTNREEKNWGIEGYEIHKKYNDARERKMLREREEKANLWPGKKGYKRPEKSEDNKDRKKVIPKRPNYLDEVFKWANSYYDKEKGERLKDELKDKHKPPEKKPPLVVGRAPRVLFTVEMEKIEKKKYEQKKELTPGYEQALEKAKKNIEDTISKQISFTEKMKKEYSEKGKKGTSAGPRVSMTAEAIFVGEQIPFYNTAPLGEKGGEQTYELVTGLELKQQYKEDNKLRKKYKMHKAVFFPRKYYLSTWAKPPKWVFKDKVEKSKDFNWAKRDEDIEEKRKALIERLNSKKAEGQKEVALDIDVPLGWFKTNYHGRYFKNMVIHEDLKKTENYLNYRKENPVKHPGPQHYWKRPKVKYVSGKAHPVEQKIEPAEDGKPKEYILESKYKMKMVYKPMKSHLF